jgi:type IV pilus assembly protein PilX
MSFLPAASSNHGAPGNRDRGAALVTMLALMLVLLMLSLGALRAALSDARSARYEADRQVAQAAAAAALADAERDIDGAAGAASPRTAIFAAMDSSAFAAGCLGKAEQAGLCLPTGGAAPPPWQAADLAGAAGVEYGRFTHRVLPVGAGMLPAAAPRYVIELLPGAAPVFRITALGQGADPATIVVLQSQYRRAAPGIAGKRLGWREIANWPALHERAS